MKHVHGFGEGVTVKIATCSISCDQIAGTVNDEFLELRVLEDYRTEEVD